MNVLNHFRAFLQLHAPYGLKRDLWNREFSTGKWKCLDETSGDCVYSFIERYAAGGDILDLGCGSGSTANEISATCYRSYTGVDVSDVAIARAMKATEKRGRSQNTKFVHSDFESYAPASLYRVILFRDSLYYVPEAKVRPLLNRLSKSLADDGVIMARFYGGGSRREKARISIIEAGFEVLEKQVASAPPAIVIVFRPAHDKFSAQAMQ